jgi:phosphoribosylanthranilate isomerase
MFVKIEGITTEEDALLVVAMGADAVGFVFAPSPRQIAPQVAADIAKRLPPEIVTIGVFRDEVPARVVKIIQASGLRGAQLHGHESAADARWIRDRLPIVIKAFPAGDRLVASSASFGVDVVLLDAPNPGSGRVFDWAFAAEVPESQRLMIAGGLHPGNVAAAIAATHPWGVDVATGVERRPGEKDPVKVREFVAAAKAAMPPTSPREADGLFDWEALP